MEKSHYFEKMKEWVWGILIALPVIALYIAYDRTKIAAFGWIIAALLLAAMAYMVYGRYQIKKYIEEQSAIVQALRVDADETGVRLSLLGKEVENLPWDQMNRIVIETNDQGPFTEDVIWILTDHSGKATRIPGSAQGVEGLLKAAQRLPNFDSEKVVATMGSTENREFVCWERDG